MTDKSYSSANLDETLLKYEPPKTISAEDNSILKDPLHSRKKNQSSLPPLENKINIEDILNSMFPPSVSTNEGGRIELKFLEDELYLKLQERQAREDLHMQLFDEIIRQCTINCPERGLLLLRVRDQIKMTFAAYQTLYQGSVVFGIRNALQAEEGMADLEQKIKDLDKKSIILENKVIIRKFYNCKKIELETTLDSIQKSFAELRTIEEAKKNAELVFLKKQTKDLEICLKGVKQQNL